MKKRIRYYLFLTLITPICLEIALRILGYSPYKQTEYSISSEPSMCLKASSDLGFSLGEGTYNVSVNGAPTYSATHTDGKRITRENRLNFKMSTIFIMGCSFTYGMGVPDSVSFPFQLQKAFGLWDIQNYGVPGFGTVQSYLQLKQEISQGNIPDLVIVNFCDFHHERNSLTPKYRNSLVMGYQRSNNEVASELKKSKFPFFENGKIISVGFHELYSNWTGRETFATVHYFQSISDKRNREKINVQKNSLAIFRLMKKLCEENDIKLIVTGLTRNSETSSFLVKLRNANIDALDISLDLRQTKYNQLPYDSHPNAKAHDYFARKLTLEINKWISSQSHAN